MQRSEISYDRYLYDVRELLKLYNNITPNYTCFDINFTKITNELYSILEDMRHNPDKRFIDRLMSTIVKLDDYYICSSMSIYYPSKYRKRDLIGNFLKCYMALKGYQSHKNSYDDYNCLLCDISSFKVKVTGEVFSNILSNNFKCVKDIVDVIVTNKYYKDMANSRRFLSVVFKEFVDCNHYLDDFKKEYGYCLDVFKDSLEEGIDFLRASQIFDSLLERKPWCLVDDKTYLYSKILLFGDRFEYVNKRLIEIEDNSFIRKDIFNYIKTLNIDLFKELNSSNYEDSFIACMNIIFDSDSYFELVSKLNSLNDASELYASGDKKQAFELVKDLDNLNHKKNYGGELVTYPNSCLNRVEKPKAIFRREKELYERIDSSISYEFMEGLHSNYRGLEEVMNDIDTSINKGIKFIRKLRRNWNNRNKSKG